MQARHHQLHGLTAATAGALLLGLWLAPPVLAGVPATSGAPRLSTAATFTTWSHPAEVRPVRDAPAASAPPIARISMRTEDGVPEVYPRLGSWTDAAGLHWIEVRVPMRPQARNGWVEASALGPAWLVQTELVVDRGHLRATLYRDRHMIWRSRIGIGKPSTPTPGGRFWIRERLRSKQPGGLYGPWAFGTSAYSKLSDWPGGGVIGIHGTNQPGLIPGRPSHGCIRVPNWAIRSLARLMPVGTRVWIR